MKDRDARLVSCGCVDEGLYGHGEHCVNFKEPTKEELKSKGNELEEIIAQIFLGWPVQKSYCHKDVEEGVQPLIDYAKTQKELTLDELRRRRALGSMIEEKDELIHKLRVALKSTKKEAPVKFLLFEGISWLKENNCIVVDKPDPEIMGEG